MKTTTENKKVYNTLREFSKINFDTPLRKLSRLALKMFKAHVRVLKARENGDTLKIKTAEIDVAQRYYKFRTAFSKAECPAFDTLYAKILKLTNN